VGWECKASVTGFHIPKVVRDPRGQEQTRCAACGVLLSGR
jgi:hypothetical protein